MGAGKARRCTFYINIMRKILIYNWLPFDEKEGKGGGVSVYTKNLLRHLTAQKDWEVCFLSSGRAYNILHRGVFIEPTENEFGDACRSFQVVNSPVLSSAHLSFAYPQACCEDTMLKQVIGKFCLEMGGFDVIHFQNLEGLSLSVLELKEEFPETRFVYSLHNYYPFCPQVMLWREDAESCREAACGSCCVSCMPKDVHRRKVVFNQWINYRMQQKGYINPILIKLQKKIEDCYRTYDNLTKGKISRRRNKKLSEAFRRFREGNIYYINKYMDEVLAVSQRTAEIAVWYGLNKEKVKISYIGTAVADGQKGCSQYPYKGEIFHICYLGYMRKMKGFYFLVDALEKMPSKLAAKIKLTLAVKIVDDEMEKRIADLQRKFAGVTVYDGYTHEQLPQILENVQLGIVPPLWEDNLPQVAIEMKAHGIPLLVSNLGGAKELALSEDFVFEAGDIDDFIRKLSVFIEFPDRLEAYWDHAPRLVTMEEHVRELMKYYAR